MVTKSPVIFAPRSKNSKIVGRGQVAATYVSIKGSCPKSCRLANSGCYAQTGRTGIHVHRLDEALSTKVRPETLARIERDLIQGAFGGRRVPQDGVKGGRDLRLHVSGDARTKAAASILAAAAQDWYKRQGGNVWTYTHAWRTVSRGYWGNISVLASIEDPRDAEKAQTQGYTPAIVVHKHPSKGAFTVAGSSVSWIACPQQTHQVPCSDCRLCFKDTQLKEKNRGIAFAAHGAVRKIKIKLIVI